MNATKTAMIASLTVLLLAMSSTASATYYYTGEYFEKTFGNASAATANAELKHDVMMYTDSDLFHKEFGVSPLKGGLFASPLIGKPDEAPAAEEASLELPANETPAGEALVEAATEPAPPEEAGEAVLLANGTEITLDNETEIVVVPIVEANKTEAAAPAAPVEQVIEEPAEEPAKEPAKEPIIAVTEDEAGVLSIDEKSNDVPADGGNASEESTLAPTPAAVSGDGTPIQIAIIAVLIVVIVAMLAVLLMREDKNEKGGKKGGKNGKGEKKDDWEEGSFFKEAKEKRSAKEPKAVEIKAADSNGKASQKKEIKPFLLKIKEEV